ncbi:MAG TPA: 2-oxoacid:acceptor oxidoreductase subunit alpha [Acidimicrobiales bacterium]|nr:2-oxoacid:acceptor oxidoreductase subunit alpha [Acidimicrobiales bacterium]
MALDIAGEAQTEHDLLKRVNDFAIKLGNVNGTGSASANTLLMRAIFRMGIPVSGKNLFPSNIQGLPTWYEIRVNRSGYTARALDYDLMVAMNAQTYAEDIREVRSGGYVLHDSTWPLAPELIRPDVNFLEVPLTTLCIDSFSAARERVLMKNICYAGALVAFLAIDLEIVSALLDETFQRNARLRESNQRALRLGYEYARDHYDCPLPFHLEAMDANSDKILVDGNTATALGCLYAGATVAAWYPITPSTSVMDNFTALCRRYRREKLAEPGPDGETQYQNNYLILQAEDELAAIGMVLGANWTGARAFTSTSGPGISLMNELLGLAYYTEIPAVIVDVQRTGPSTGMPTRTQQGDILACAYASHGDTKHLLLFPANPAECFEFSIAAFDLAERFQTPVIMLSDLDIGMNDWVVPTLRWDDAFVPDRGRVLDAAELKEISRFFRYNDEDEDFVAARTLPGVDEKGAYFIRGSGHDRYGAYTEVPDQYQEVVDRLAKKHAAAGTHMPEPVIERHEGAQLGVVAVGSCDLAIREALELLEESGIPVDFLRIRGFPFSGIVQQFLDEHDLCFVIEQNRDAQLRSLLKIETCIAPEKLRSVLVYGGFPLSAKHVIDGITSQLGD